MMTCIEKKKYELKVEFNMIMWKDECMCVLIYFFIRLYVCVCALQMQSFNNWIDE